MARIHLSLNEREMNCVDSDECSVLSVRHGRSKNSSGLSSIRGGSDFLSISEATFDRDGDVKDICATCFSREGIIRSATHFCKQCGILGHFICETCLVYHKQFTNHTAVQSFAAAKYKNRDVEKLETVSSTSEPIRPDRKLEKENVMLKKEVQDKEGMLTKLKKDMQEKENKITELDDEIKETQERAYKTMIIKSERIATRDSEELAKLKRDLTILKTEKDDIKRKMEDMKKEKDAAVAKKVKEIKNLEKEKDELLCRERIATRDSEELGKLKRELTNMKTEKDDIKSKMKDMEKEKDAAVAKKVKEIRNLEKEKDELLCRLSEIAGRRRLPDNNPNIADLSDLNRPTKLAEKYAELYDNDWTDAYSYLETLDAYKGSEVTVIAALMTMLTTAYKMSLKTSESQLEALHHILSDFQGSIQHQDQQIKDVIKQLKYQRKRAVQPSKDLTEKYRKEIEKAFPKLDSSIFESDALKPYLQKCLQLCWLMAIQDPPVHLKCDGCKKGELFDKNMYKENTQAGPLVIYTVWPAMLLEKDGALLCKGVVQCDKRVA